MDDCFDDLEEPTYGFRAKVTLVENSPCILGSTCRGTPTLDFIAKRSDSSSDDITVENLTPEDVLDTSEDVLDERQSGEEFFSEAPPDCRVTCQ